MRCFIYTLLCLSYAFARHEKYDGQALFSVKIQNAEQARYFNTLEYPLDIWQYATQTRDGMVLVPKDYIQQFQDQLFSNGMEFVVEIGNIKESLELEDKLMAEKASNEATTSANDNNGPLVNFKKIYNLTEVNSYLEKVADAYPDVVTLVSGGKSFEGRDVNYLKISNTKFENTSKPVIFVQSLLHGREWISLPATMYAIQKLVVNVTEQNMIDDYDWIILPVANPDSYEYTYTSDNRFWRKNRRTGLIANDTCVGVDINRNFDVFFGLGPNYDVCSDNYYGPVAFSEPESCIIRDILVENANRIELFLDLHSFGSMILYGWGIGELPPNVVSLHAGGLQMAEAIDAVKEEYNKNYTVGNFALVRYLSSGSAMDYSYLSGVSLSYVYEMPAYRAPTRSGYLVNPDFIEQAGIETWEGIKTGARYARSIMKPRV